MIIHHDQVFSTDARILLQDGEVAGEEGSSLQPQDDPGTVQMDSYVKSKYIKQVLASYTRLHVYNTNFQDIFLMLL